MNTGMIRSYGMLFICLCLWLPSVQATEVFVWIDAQGKKHFSDQPTDEALDSGVMVSEEIRLQNVDQGYPAGILGDPDRGERQAKVVKEKARLAATQEERCAEARSALSDISGRVTFSDDDGNVVKVTEAERRKMASDLGATIQKHCGNRR